LLEKQQECGSGACTCTLAGKGEIGMFGFDDFDPYINDLERAETGTARCLVKDELYMPVHPTRDWVKCFVTTSSQNGYW
jgi:hypothetical protein